MTLHTTNKPSNKFYYCSLTTLYRTFLPLLQWSNSPTAISGTRLINKLLETTMNQTQDGVTTNPNNQFKVLTDCEALLPALVTGKFTLHENTGISWSLYDEQHNYLYNRIKALGGRWNGQFWELNESAGIKNFLEFPVQKKKIREYKVVKSSEIFSGTTIKYVKLNNGSGYFFHNNPDITRDNLEHSWIDCKQSNRTGRWAEAVVVSASSIEYGIEKYREKGAKIELVKHNHAPVTILKNTIATQLICSPETDPSHYLLKEEFDETWEWKQSDSGLSKKPIIWNGVLVIPSMEIERWKTSLKQLGIPFHEESISSHNNKVTLDYNKIPGWNLPAKNGRTLHEYQKSGIQFIADKNGRAINGDEMGTGKTIQSIAYAQGCSANKILVIVPANARYVWDSEIRSWLGDEELIQHITSNDDIILDSARWLITTYDVLVPRVGSLIIKNRPDINEFKKNDGLTGLEIEELGSGNIRVRIKAPVQIDALSEITAKKLNKINKRLNNSLANNLISANFDLAIADEAHYIKNPESKRTKAASNILGHIDQKILLSGTPIRNRLEEAETLLGLICSDIKNDIQLLSQGQNCYSATLTKKHMENHMIRRTKQEVLPELPLKIRSWNEVKPDMRYDKSGLQDRYHDCMAQAHKNYKRFLATKDDDSKQYFQHALGNIEQARTVIGQLKLIDGEFANYIKGVLSQKESCIIFCAHRAVSDELSSQLSKLMISNVVVDGRTKQIDRKRVEESFQRGEIQVFIGGIRAAGEAITLTRSDTCIFLEPDWVPASMMQAEDRGHRIGQKSSGYQIVHWMMSPTTGLKLDHQFTSMLRQKIEIINQALDEETDFEFKEPGTEDNMRLSLMSNLFGR